MDKLEEILTLSPCPILYNSASSVHCRQPLFAQRQLERPLKTQHNLQAAFHKITFSTNTIHSSNFLPTSIDFKMLPLNLIFEWSHTHMFAHHETLLMLALLPPPREYSDDPPPSLQSAETSSREEQQHKGKEKEDKNLDTDGPPPATQHLPAHQPRDQPRRGRRRSSVSSVAAATLVDELDSLERRRLEKLLESEWQPAPPTRPDPPTSSLSPEEELQGEEHREEPELQADEHPGTVRRAARLLNLLRQRRHGTPEAPPAPKQSDKARRGRAEMMREMENNVHGLPEDPITARPAEKQQTRPLHPESRSMNTRALQRQYEENIERAKQEVIARGEIRGYHDDRPLHVIMRDYKLTQQIGDVFW